MNTAIVWLLLSLSGSGHAGNQVHKVDSFDSQMSCEDTKTQIQIQFPTHRLMCVSKNLKVVKLNDSAELKHGKLDDVKIIQKIKEK